MANQLQGLKVAIPVTDDLEQAELIEPRKALDGAVAKTTVISPKQGQIQGRKHDEKADKVKVGMVLDQANPEAFDAVLLPGSALNGDNLHVEKKAQEFVRKMDPAGTPIALIGHAPWLLVSAGLLRGRKMTSYHTIQDDLRNAGAPLGRLGMRARPQLGEQPTAQ